MSGGSYNYIYSELFRECEGRMHDAEMEDLVSDLCKVLHDLEWWQSCDTSEDTYRETVAKFKAKWFKCDRSARLKGYIDTEIYKLYSLIMSDTERKIEKVVDDLQEGKITPNQARERFNLPPVESKDKSINKPPIKTLEEILEEVKKSMCDNYCKYPNMENDNEDWLFEDGSPCETCPLNKL